jgi:hypothetical protein
MSCNRENVIWKSKNGTWSRGFFEFYQTGDDHEWDVEYIHSSFHWVSTGHASREEANKSWGGSNPGGYWIHDKTDADTDRYDEMAEKLTTALKEQAVSNPRKVFR